MATHFRIIFLTLACLLLIYFIAWLQVHFHLCIKINEYHSSLQNKPTVAENLHFRMDWPRIQESQLHFYPLLLLILMLLPSIHFFFISPFDMALFTTSQFEEQLVHRRRNTVTNSVAQRQNKWNSTSNRKGRRQATETEWNLSVFLHSECQKGQETIHSCFPRTFHISPLIKIVFEQPFEKWIVKASRLRSLEGSTNKTHVKSFEYINRETQSIRENSGSANCKTF